MIERTTKPGHERRTLGELQAGDEFVTCLTELDGYVMGDPRAGSGVEVELGLKKRVLHPGVVVLVKA